MPKKKSYKKKTGKNILNEPVEEYKAGKITFFESFEEQADYELKQMAALSPEQILLQLRRFITIAYGMHGYDPDNLPTKHSVKIIQY